MSRHLEIVLPAPGPRPGPDKSLVSINDSEKYNEVLLIKFADDKTVAGMVIRSDHRNRVQNDGHTLEHRVNSFSRDEYWVPKAPAQGLHGAGVT